jgi:hypothetical protein
VGTFSRLAATAVLITATFAEGSGWYCNDYEVKSECPVFVQSRFLRHLAGGGALPGATDGLFTTSIDYGVHPFEGAFATGVWSTISAASSWSVGSFGVFLELDLTYVALSHLWDHNPPATFPFRLQAGAHLGLDASQSFLPRPELPNPKAYVLFRPSTQGYVTLEIPVTEGAPRFSVLVRGAIDGAVSLNTLYRWSLSAGFSYGYDRPQ